VKTGIVVMGITVVDIAARTAAKKRAAVSNYGQNKQLLQTEQKSEFRSKKRRS